MHLFLSSYRTHSLLKWSHFEYYCGKLQTKLRCDHCICNPNLSSHKFKKKNRASTRFKPMASALALHLPYQLSYEDSYAGTRPIYRVHGLPVTGNTNEIETWSSQLQSQFKQLQILARNTFPGLQQDLNPCLYVSAAVPTNWAMKIHNYVGSRPTYQVHLYPWQE